MSIYKSSHHYPSLSEIDVSKTNEFSCQVNTSGESVQAYKIQILSGRGDEVIIDGDNNDKKGTNLRDLGKKPVKNKGILKVLDSVFKDKSKLINGKDYQWGIRTYAAPINSIEQPKTLVCSGFLVGSTQYVIWVNLDTDNETKENMNNLLQYDRYIEFKIPKEEISTSILPFASSYETDIIYPPEPNDSSQNYYVQRRKIDWVEKELGKDKKITKIETEENFDYNFADGTQFSIYLCSDQHTPNAIYVDPNDIIEPSNYIVIYNSKTEYDAAKNDADNVNDPTKGTIRNTLRKIYGYSSDTGEIRVQEAYGDENDPVPVNGNYYRIFEYDIVNKTYTEKTGSIEQVIGGSPLKDSNNLFKVYSNKWSGADAEDNRVFIQPNINIKIDRTNYNEIVFDDGTRVDIIPDNVDEDEDDTFEKLDNTQWLLKGKRIGLVTGFGDLYNIDSGINNILPKTNYSVYTDFIDSSPYNIFYAREVPALNIIYTNANKPSEVLENEKDVDGNLVKVGYRDIQFRTPWIYSDGTTPLQDVKYYQYRLYDEDGDLIEQSEELYSTDLFDVNGDYKTILTWSFRGLETGSNIKVPRNYTIELVVVDEYGNNFSTSTEFGVYYTIESDFIPLTVTLDCEERAISIEANAPVYVKSTDDTESGKPTVDENNIKIDYLSIPVNKVLNYTTVVSDEEEIPIIISENMSLLTRFQIKGDFVDEIPTGEELEIIKFASKRYTNKEANEFVIDEYKFTLGSFTTFYINNDGKYVKNENQFKLRWYKNDEVINCFSGENYMDLTLLYEGFIAIQNIKSAIQERGSIAIIQLSESTLNSVNYNNVFSYVQKELETLYPNTIVNNRVVNDTTILLKDTYNSKGENISSHLYSSGLYVYTDEKGWQPDLTAEYIFIDDLDYVSEIEGVSFDSLGVPEQCRGIDNSIMWVDSVENGNGQEQVYDYIWIENNHMNTKNKETLNRAWFTMYFISDNTKKENQFTCEIRVRGEENSG